MASSVYLAGPMSGYPSYNFRAFEIATERLREDGWEVFSPHEITCQVWQREYGKIFDPAVDKADWGDPILDKMLAEDLTAVAKADVLALLPGWEKSKGARIEIRVARLLKKPVRTYDVMTATFHDVPVGHEPESALEEAQRLVHGDRQAAYGHPIEDYRRIGRMQGAILDGWLRQQPGFENIPEVPDIDPRISCLFMEPVKISREVNKPKRDNRVDGAGYWECVNLIAERQGV